MWNRKLMTVVSPFLMSVLLMVVLYFIVGIAPVNCADEDCGMVGVHLTKVTKHEVGIAAIPIANRAVSADTAADTNPEPITQGAPAPMLITAHEADSATGSGQVESDVPAALVMVADEAASQAQPEQIPAMDPAQEVTLKYDFDCYDLDAGELTTAGDDEWTMMGACPAGSDFQVAYNSRRSEPAVLILQHGTTQVGEATTEWEDKPWQGARIVLTPEGNRFRLRLLVDEVMCGAAVCAVIDWQALPPL